MKKLMIALAAASAIGFANVSAADYNDNMKEGMPGTGKAGAMGKTMEHAPGTVDKCMDHKMGGMAHHQKHAKAMDTNSDGMISRDEFLKHHGAMYDKMKKNPKGGVDMKDFGIMHSTQDRSLSAGGRVN